MKKIKEWWNDFKIDLIFNMIMCVVCGMLFLTTVYLGMFVIKEINGELKCSCNQSTERVEQ